MKLEIRKQETVVKKQALPRSVLPRISLQKCRR
jgi:hypothetical protein